MIRPKGQAFRNWKKAEMRRRTREGLPRPKDWIQAWEERNPSPGEGRENDLLRITQLECSRLRSEALTHRMVRREILGLSEATPAPPDWLLAPSKGAPHNASVPVLLATDWHWGERVEKGQVGGVNEYDLSRAHARARTLIQRTVNILKHHVKHPNYPGIVFAMAGDFFSGDIHDELSRTNEMPIMPTLLDLHGVLIWCIETLATEFGRVFIPAVAGNHSRITAKPIAKNRASLNFDWLLYCLLEKYFKNDPRVTFLIPEGSDAIFRIYSRTYCLTHGDQFRGGGGIAGVMVPILRGDSKKRSRNGQIGEGYSHLICGHFHQTIQTGQVMIGGSLVGYNEFAHINNFPYEPPQQSLWLTHPEHGITFSMPIRVDDAGIPSPSTWVSWPDRMD
jgi:hypothetical protein